MLKKRKVKEKLRKTKTKFVVEEKKTEPRLPKRVSRTIWIAFLISAASFLMAVIYRAVVLH